MDGDEKVNQGHGKKFVRKNEDCVDAQVIGRLNV